MKRKFWIILAAVLVGSILLATCQVQIGGIGKQQGTATPSTTSPSSSAIPIILGAMDPLVVPDDNAKLANQVQYLDAMQSAMNTSVHPGGNWNWRSQAILGLIDSWHNGYPSAATNNLYQLFAFWAQQLH